MCSRCRTRSPSGRTGVGRRHPHHPLAPTGRLVRGGEARELDNNCQSILGYVVRWIDHGVGCSKVPDIHDVALMEDRATLRISSQLLANWMRHGVVTADDIEAALGGWHRWSTARTPMTRTTPDGPDFASALPSRPPGTHPRGRLAASGYTEPILHRRRRGTRPPMAHSSGGGRHGLDSPPPTGTNSTVVGAPLLAVALVVLLLAGGAVAWFQARDKVGDQADSAAGKCVEGPRRSRSSRRPISPRSSAISRSATTRRSRWSDHCVTVQVRPGDSKVTLDGLRGQWDIASMGERPPRGSRSRRSGRPP